MLHVCSTCWFPIISALMPAILLQSEWSGSRFELPRGAADRDRDIGERGATAARYFADSAGAAGRSRAHA